MFLVAIHIKSFLKLRKWADVLRIGFVKLLSFCLFSKVIQCNTEVKKQFKWLKKKHIKEYSLKEKIPTANYPKRVTIFTANFWKLIAIRGALIQGLSWLLKYQISKCRMWRLFDFSFSKRFFFMLKLVIAACRVEYDKYFMSPSYFTIYFRTIRHLGTWVKYSAEYEKWIKYLPILHNADLLQYAKK